MTSSPRLPAELWKALLASPEGSIEFQEQGRLVQLRFLPHATTSEIPAEPTRSKRSSSLSKESLETNPEMASIKQRLRTIDIGLLLDLGQDPAAIQTSHPGLGPGLAGPLRNSEELPSVFSRRSPTPANPATLRTMLERLEKAEAGAQKTADLEALGQSFSPPSLFPRSASKTASSIPSILPPKDAAPSILPPLTPRDAPPSNPSSIPPLPPLPSSPLSSPSASSSPSSEIPVVQGIVLENPETPSGSRYADLFAPETQDLEIHPLMLSEAQLSSARSSETSLLRPADIHLALNLLFSRLATPTTKAASILTPEEKMIDLLAFAQKADVTHLLVRRLPICESLFSPPSTRLIGKCRDGSFVLIVHHYERIHFEPIPPDGGHLYLAVLAEDPILTKEELSQFALLSQAASSEGRPNRTAKAGPSRSGPIAITSLLDSATHAQARSRQALHALPVDAAFFQRLTESLASPVLWDASQEGLFLLKDTVASLYEGDNHLIEGLFIFLKDRRQALVYDRKTKRSLSLNFSSRQRLWLQKIPPPPIAS